MKKPSYQKQKIYSAAITFLLLVYLGLLLFPEIVFGHKVVYGPFIVYSHAPLPKQIEVVLDSARNLLKRSEFNKAHPAAHKLFFCSSLPEYAFFAPSSYRAFANNNWVTGKIVLAKADVANNSITSNAPQNNRRSLSGTIAHEITHSNLRHAFGRLKEMQLETWKKEGYCDVIAHESSFGFAKGLVQLCKTEAPTSPSFQYFKYRLYVAQLLKNKHQTFSEIAGESYDTQALDQSIKKQYCR